MEIQFTNSHRNFPNVLPALFLGAILCNVFAVLDWWYLLPFALIGVILPLIPQVRYRKAQYVLWGVLGAWLLIHFGPILDGGKLLANRMFALSESSQSYEYDYFTVSGESAEEAVLWLSMLTGTLCALWGNKSNAVLCGLWLLAMAYFGVTPGIFWLTVLALGGFLSVLPGQHRWFYGLITVAAVAGIAFAVSALAPEPSDAVSSLDDHLRDVLAASPVTYEQTPVPTEVPEPELVPQPSTQLEQPDHGVQKAAANILFFLLAGITLALLFVPAIFKDRAAKKRQKARAGFDAPDHGAAIRAMYLYAQRWRKLSQRAGQIPAQVQEIWLEAAYSDHIMSQGQRDTVYAYMKETAEKVWQESDWKMRLRIRCRIFL